MNKLLRILVITLFVLSLIPPIATATPLTTKYINEEPYNDSIVAYAKYGNYVAYAYGLSSSAINAYDLVVAIFDNTGTLIRNETITPPSVVSGDVDIAGNDTGFLVAYTQYRSGYAHDIKLEWVPLTGSLAYYSIMYTDAEEVTPLVAYGNGYWLVGFVNATDNTINVWLFDKSDLSTPIYNKSFSIGTYGAVDTRERAFYDPVTQKFYIVVRLDSSVSGTDTSDLGLVVVDPTGPTASLQQLTSTTDKDEGYCDDGIYHKRMYTRFYAQLLEGGGKLLVVYGYLSGSTNIDALIVDLSTLTTTSVTIATEGGDTSFYPWIAASSTEWLVVWSYNNNIYAKFVYPDGTTSSTWILGAAEYGYITAVYNGENYTVVYGHQTASGTYDLYAIQLATDGKRSSSSLTVVATADDEAHPYPLVLGTLHTVLYIDTTAAKTYVALFDVTEVPKPTSIPTELTITSITKNDVNGDNVLEADQGESVTIQGTLTENGTGAGIGGKTITATLYRYVYYNSETHHDEFEEVATASTTTQADGSFSVTINIPSTALSGIYYVKVEFAGEDPYAGTSASTSYFIILSKTPATITWETVPTEIAVGPAMLIKNGQVIITDPAGEPQTDNRYGTSIADLLKGEADDVDIRLLQLAVDGNYLYVKAEFTGTAEPLGDVAPVLALAFDFTPDNPSDGADYNKTNFRLVYKMGYSDTYLKRGNAWDAIAVITPKDKAGYVFSDDGHYTVYMYVAHESSGSWYFRELDAGYADLSGNTITAYIPLDIIRNYNPHLASSGVQAFKMFAAVFPVNISTGKIVSGIPFANWVDVPGIVTYNTTPTSALYLGITESWKDNDAGLGGYELDTYFILNADLDNNKFFGYAEVYMVDTNITVAGFDELRFDAIKAFVGNTEYIVRIVDANNTIYGIVGKTITLVINNTDAESGTSTVINNRVGYASIIHTWSTTEWKNIYILNVKFTGDADYRAATSRNYTVKVMYLINVSSVTYNWTDKDHDLAISRGDILTLKASVKVWDGTAWVTAPAGVGVKFYLHSSPVYLGTAYTDPTGVAELVYTFTGDEYLLGTGHYVTASGDGDTSWTTTFPGYTLNLPQQFFVLPAPEPPILPILLLAAMLLLLVYKRKK